jgi:NADH dehydrogenase
MGRSVRTLTGHPERPNPFGDQVEAAPFSFHRYSRLVSNLRGAEVLYNTYWVRFPRGKVSYERAVENSKRLFSAAKEAGVQRVVHLSITNPSEDSPFPYFKGKAQVERAIAEAGLSYGIVRPTVVFGLEDVLVNNIAWLLRRFPVFAVPGSGQQRLQPVYVDDVGAISVEVGQESASRVLDAAGPEIFTFEEMVRLIRDAVGSRALLVRTPQRVAFGVARLVGLLVRDVVVTGDELVGLAADLVISSEPPRGQVRFSDWIQENKTMVGTTWASELGRHYR